MANSTDCERSSEPFTSYHRFGSIPGRKEHALPMHSNAPAICGILLLLTGSTLAQTRRVNKPVAKPPSTSEASTPNASPRKVVVKLKDGRSVDADFVQATTEEIEVRVAGNLLRIKMDDLVAIVFSGEASSQAAAPAVPTTATLAIEAGIIYKMGGNQPVGRTEFRLLDTDLISLITASGYTPPSSSVHLQDPKEELLLHWAIDSGYSSKSSALLQIDESILKHTVQTVTTDFNGKAEFTDIKPGQYFVFARAQTRTERGFAIWNVPVEIKPGRNSVTLDQNNTGVIY